MKVVIVSPEKKLFSNTANSIVVPGTKGTFEILENHAPIISSLQQGIIRVVSNNDKFEFSVKSGFVEVVHNTVTICIES